MKTSILAVILIVSSMANLSYGADSASPTEALLVTTAKNTEGEVLLADATGKTLYVFDLDEGKPTPVCTADCAEVWPPYLLTAAEAGKLKAPLGQILRANKKSQLTYAGRPVYTYAFDRAAGDDKGDGLGDVWHYIEVK